MKTAVEKTAVSECDEAVQQRSLSKSPNVNKAKTRVHGIFAINPAHAACGACGCGKIIRLVIILFGLIMLEGCGTFDSSNVAARPWNRSTKWEVEHDWFYPSEYEQESRDNYP